MHLLRLCALSALMLTLNSPLFAKTYDYKAKAEGGTNFLTAEFRCWIPETEKPLRGALVYIPSQNADGREYLEEDRLQEKCKEWNFALIGCHFTGDADKYYTEARRGSGRALEDALRDFADQSGKSELSNAPMALYGFSAGAQFAYSMACYKPEDVISFVSDKGVFFTSRPSANTFETPALFIVGEDDKDTKSKENSLKAFTRGKKRLALWAMHTESNKEHEAAGKSIQKQAFAYMNAAIELRTDPERPFAKPDKVRSDVGIYLQRETGEIVERDNRDAEESPDWSWIPDKELAEKILKEKSLLPKSDKDSDKDADEDEEEGEEKDKGEKDDEKDKNQSDKK